MAGHMSPVIFPFLMTIILRLVCVAKAQTCAVGDNADSTRFAPEFVFGLFPSVASGSYIGDYGCFSQTDQSSGTTFTASRPAQLASATFSLNGMPGSFKVTYTAESSVTRTTGLHDGTLRITLDDNLRMYLYGSDFYAGTYGASAVVPHEYQGQEYFASVRAGPGLGQVIISSTGEVTFVRIRPNGPFTYDGITYSSPFSDLEVEIPAWYQMVITTTSNDFTGSRILANKSISVVSGSTCAYSLETLSGSCDYAIEHLIPYDKWGTTFNVPPFSDGSTGYYVQVTAGRDDTNINVDGTSLSLSQGQTESREVTSNTMIRITSDKPIQVVQFLKGATSMVVIPPQEQYTVQNTYIRMIGASTLGLNFNHYFTIVAPCTSGSGLYITYTSPSYPTYLASLSGSTSNGDMCAYFYIGSQAFTYTITQSDPNGAFFVVIYGADSSAGFAYVGGQKYETQRCPDYHVIMYDSETTTSEPTTTQTTTTQPTTTQTTTTQPTTTQTTTTQPTTTLATTTKPTTTQTTTTQPPTTQTTTTQPTTTQTTTTTTEMITTAASTESPTTTTTTTTTTEAPATTTPAAPARKTSGIFSLRYTDKTVHTSKQIQTVEGPTTQIRCAQQCISTTICQAFTWVATSRHCVLSGSIDDPTDLVQEVGVTVFVRS